MEWFKASNRVVLGGEHSGTLLLARVDAVKIGCTSLWKELLWRMRKVKYIQHQRIWDIRLVLYDGARCDDPRVMVILTHPRLKDPETFWCMGLGWSSRSLHTVCILSLNSVGTVKTEQKHKIWDFRKKIISGSKCIYILLYGPTFRSQLPCCKGDELTTRWNLWTPE